MAIRHLLLAALVTSVFSTSALAESSIYGSTGSGTVLLATSSTGQVQTYMPRAVESFFFTYTAPPVLLAGSGQSTVTGPAAGSDVVVSAPEVSAPVEVLLPDPITVGGPPVLGADLAADVAADVSVDAAPPSLLAPLAEAAAVPEPGTGGLMLAGLAGVGMMARRRRAR
jgi:hypothetical protein